MSFEVKRKQSLVCRIFRGFWVRIIPMKVDLYSNMSNVKDNWPVLYWPFLLDPIFVGINILNDWERRLCWPLIN